MEPRVLLLNASYEPLKIISWQKAICLWFDEKVEIVKEYTDHVINSVSQQMNCPAVVRLLKYVNSRPDKVRFNRINVYTRDSFTCQYCGHTFPINKLTYDHIQPKSRGGKTEWTNIVTSCYGCNSQKADRTPDEAKMKLKARPYRPEWTPRTRLSLPNRKIPAEWADYLYGDIET